MKKIAILISATILALFMNPFGQSFANAQGDSYDNIKDGSYEINAKALHETKNEPSSAAGFIKEKAQLNVKDGQVSLVLTVLANDYNLSMQVEGIEPTKNGETWTYKITNLKNILNAKVQYDIPPTNHRHDVAFRFALEGLDQLPKNETTEVDEKETEEDKEVDKEEEKEKEESVKPLNNGYYKASASYLHASKDEVSSMGSYLSESLFLNVQGKETEVTITVNADETVTALKVNGQQSIASKVDGNTRYETFKINNDGKTMSAYVEYQAPYGDTIHKGNATFRIAFDGDKVQKVSANDQPGKDLPSNDLKLADGLYAIDVSFINAKNGQASTMARYLGDKAYLSVTNGQAEVYFVINDNGTVTKLKMNNQEKLNEIINGKVSLQSFKIDPLVAEMTGYAEYQAPFNGSVHKGNAEFNVVLNAETIQSVKELPIQPEQPKEEPKEEETKQPEKPEQPAEDQAKETPEKTAAKGYSIQYVVKHATEDEVSAADNFFAKPGILLKKDGKNYLQITINNWSMIGWLKVNNKAVTVVTEDKKADTAVVQFELPTDLTQVAQVTMQVSVPGLYETEHAARLVLDAATLVEDKSDTQYFVHVPSSGGNKQAIDKPNLDADEQTNGSKVNNSSGQVNPQTGDKSQIGFFVTLLISSLALLAVQYRRRVMN